jgi:hypothetical protein
MEKIKFNEKIVFVVGSKSFRKKIASNEELMGELCGSKTKVLGKFIRLVLKIACFI